MDLSRFAALLQTSSLHLSRVDDFKDEFEGSLTALVFNSIPTVRQKELHEVREKLRQTVYVNCWYSNPYESDAMWALYGPEKKAVAIRTTYRRLFASLNDGVLANPLRMIIGTTDYVDFDRDIGGDHRKHLNFFFTKRQSFAHEHELRVVVEDARSDDQRSLNLPLPNGVTLADGGLRIPVPLNALVEHVFVSPKAELWFVDVVTKLSCVYEITAPVKRSDLDRKPLK